MIFVTLGSQKFQFNRLLIQLDNLVERGIIQDKVFAQRGSSDYLPKNYESVQFLDREKFGQYMSECDVVITHAGTGAIMGAVKRGKKVIAVPRKKKYGEHVDEHQMQIVEEFEQLDIIEPCYEVEDLENAYKKIFEKEYTAYQSNTQAYLIEIEQIVESI